MASIIEEPRTPASRRLLTAEDLAALPEQLPSGPVKYELDQGRLETVMAPPGEVHGSHQATVVFLLKLHGQRPGHGRVLGETGIILRRNPDTVVAPDAAFIASRSLPVEISSEGYLLTIPELVVEIRSKNDTVAEMRARAEKYLRAGVQIVWLIDPGAKSMTVCRAQETREVKIGDILTAEGVIPGFQVPVAELFGR